VMGQAALVDNACEAILPASPARFIVIYVALSAVLTKSVKLVGGPFWQKWLPSTTFSTGAHGTSVTLISGNATDQGGSR